MQRLQHVGPDLLFQMVADDSGEAAVQLVAVFVQDHRIRVPVKLLKAEAAVVLLLNLLNRALQQVPHVHHVFLVHRSLSRDNGT